MQKLKKALKKLANFKVKPAAKAKAAQPAKKAPSAKKKTQVLAKKSAKPAGKKPVVAAGAKKTVTAKPVKGKPAAKAEQKKKVPAAAPSAKVSALKTAEKPGAPKPAKATAKKTAVETAPIAKQTGKKSTESAAPAKALKGKKSEAERTEVAPTPDEEIILTDAEGRRYCRVKDCDQAAVVDGGYCRYHYLLFWKNIQNRKKILSEGKLERYIEELTARYPDKYLELLRKDLRSEKDFMAAIQELEIDESGVDNEFEDEAQSYLDEVRGISGSEPATEREEDF